MTHSDTVHLTKIIKASRKAVFEAWLEPESLAKFMTPGPGMSVPKAESDAREGGSFLIVMKAGDKELPHSGKYTQIKKYETLAFTWVSPFSTVDSLVTLTFKELGPEETELVLLHAGFTDEDSRKNHEGGWQAILDVLGATLS